MKHGSNSRRGRARGSNRRGSPSKNTTFESNGPSVKIRGTAQQVQEKYIALARDASSAGDRILAEGYLQFAEHYYRVASAAAEQQASRNKDRQQSGEDASKQADESADDAVANDGDTDAAADDDDGDDQPVAEAPKRGRRRGAQKAQAEQPADAESVDAGVAENAADEEEATAEAVNA